jgi:hypothetical protein
MNSGIDLSIKAKKKKKFEDLILRLRVKENNKLFKIRVISYDIIPKEKPYTKRISIAKSLMANIFL